MATRYILERVGSKRVMAPSRVVRFQSVENLHMYNRSWETTARVVSGRIKHTRTGDVIYRAILADLSGDKMEAIAYGQQAYRLANELQISEVYLIRGLGFQTADMPPRFGLVISTDFYVVMHSWTQVHLAGPNISIPVLPSQFMDFDDAARLRDKMLTDVIGIVMQVGPIRFHKSYDRSTPCRDVVLMNIRRELICLRIWDRHVSRHLMKWRRAERDMCILAATLFEVSTRQGALKTIDESHIVFEPDNLLAYELAAFRHTLGQARRSMQSRVRAFVRQRIKMGLYDNLRLGRL